MYTGLSADQFTVKAESNRVTYVKPLTERQRSRKDKKSKCTFRALLKAQLLQGMQMIEVFINQ